jgi:hypothetical protein
MTDHGLVMTGANEDEVWPLVRDHHYSARMPANISRCFAWREPGGLFGDTGAIAAAVIYGVPGGRCWPRGSLELQRLVRTPQLSAPLSSFVAWSLRLLRGDGAAAFVLSYADTSAGHHGGIYQACGFSYVAQTRPFVGQYYEDAEGRTIHGRTVFRQLGTTARDAVAVLRPDWKPTAPGLKHLYVKPLRQNLKPLLKRFGWMELPFPKPDAPRPEDVVGTPDREPGATPGRRSIFPVSGDA